MNIEKYVLFFLKLTKYNKKENALFSFVFNLCTEQISSLIFYKFKAYREIYNSYKFRALIITYQNHDIYICLVKRLNSGLSHSLKLCSLLRGNTLLRFMMS